ncbi:hypothetical protein SCLCIDRAFT_117548 [Scleroderma citrinum Foug A]|uniref:Uncharacterized protein n=1 Tax=Scleroderma citrinum Foug A TaxID=1036808 RepID=A0A0C3DRU3_9AGAM|nr:hypothetical protein SCLCIDRAFT_117548 [Scleroderma citrinum Foug A]
MGKSAKLHKRMTKTSSSQHHVPLPEHKPKPKSSAPTTTETAIESAKKRADLRSKVKSRGKSGSKGADGGYVLGQADYVTLMMGGRRRVAEEALKLPKDS